MNVYRESLASESAERWAMADAVRSNGRILRKLDGEYRMFSFTGGSVGREAWDLQSIGAYFADPATHVDPEWRDAKGYCYLAEAIMALGNLAACQKPKTLRQRHAISNTFAMLGHAIERLERSLLNTADASPLCRPTSISATEPATMTSRDEPTIPAKGSRRREHLECIASFKAYEQNGASQIVQVWTHLGAARGRDLSRAAPTELILTTSQGSAIDRVTQGQYRLKDNPSVRLSSDDPEAP